MTVSDPADLAPETAVERFLDRRAASVTQNTIRSYRNRLNRLLDFCDEVDVNRVGDLSPWILDQYLDRLGAAAGAGDIAPTTHKGHVVAVNQFAKYLDGIGAVDDGLQEAIEVPRVDAQDEASDKSLDTEDARRLLQHYRHSPAYYATPRHTMLEVAWCTGARIGGIRALDLGDVDREACALSFRHRPSTDTPLKNKHDGERDVGIPAVVRDVLDAYCQRDRPGRRDDHGRAPLFATSQGRASLSTLRAYTYLATQPCVAVRCPHGRTIDRCSYRRRTFASKCPSSRSPHHIRSGSITWQLNSGVPLEVVSERVNASPRIIAKHYDVAGARERLEQRRRPFVDRLDVVDDTVESSSGAGQSQRTTKKPKDGMGTEGFEPPID